MMMDVEGGYKSWEAAGTEFGKKALSSAASAAVGGVFSGFKGIESGMFAYGGLNAGVNTMTGMSGVIAHTAMTGLQSYTTSTVTSAINAIQWDGNGFGWSGDAFNAGMQAGLISAATGMTSTFASGTLGQMSLFDGNRIGLSNKVFNTGSIASFNSLAGGLAGQGVNYALGGDFTLNVLNASNLSGGALQGGLLELHLGRNGMSMNVGMGGADANLGTIAASMSGLRDTLKIANAKTAALFGGLEGVSTLNAVNMLGYSEDTNNFALGRNIWSDALEASYGDTGGDYGYYNSNDPETVMLSEKLLGGGKEESAKLATIMAHEGTHVAGNRYESEAHKQGALTYGSLLNTFGLQGDQAFSAGMVAALMNPESYKANTGNTDHWKMMSDGKLVYDGQGYLKDESGKYVNKDGTRSDKPGSNTIGASGVETGLLNILFGKDVSGKELATRENEDFSPEERAMAQKIMIDSGLTHSIGDAAKRMWKGTQRVDFGVVGGPQKVDLTSINMDRELNMQSVMAVTGTTIASEVFGRYFNSTADGMIAFSMELSEVDQMTYRIVDSSISQRFQGLLKAKADFYSAMGSFLDLRTRDYSVTQEHGRDTMLDGKYAGYDYRHFGTDIAGKSPGEILGDRLYLGISGTVTDRYVDKGDGTGNGNGVAVEYGYRFEGTRVGTGVMGEYLHMRDVPLVGKGQELGAAALIGYVGNTGNSDGPHLHYTMYTQGANAYSSSTLLMLLGRDGVNNMVRRTDGGKNTYSMDYFTSRWLNYRFPRR